jgi:hypothetical protein
MPSTQISRRRLLSASAGAAAGGWFTKLGRLLYAAPRKNDWIELFDGKTLNGWHRNPQRIGHGTGGLWTVQQGAICGRQDPPGSGNGGILLTDQTFGDFELILEMKPDWGVCSGLFLRGNDRGQCLQMMVDYHDGGNVGHVYGEGTGGFNTRTFDIDGEYDTDRRLVGLTTARHRTKEEAGVAASCVPEQWLAAWRIDDWNETRVVVTGQYPRVTTWINGLMVCDFDGAQSMIAGYDREKVFQTLGASGSIAVQVHGGKGWPERAACRWRQLRLRRLEQ